MRLNIITSLVGLLTVTMAMASFQTFAETQSAASTSQKKITNPTLAFFVALHACNPGDYQEKNIMSAIVGPSMLQHTINGEELLGGCSVMLQTPDGRYMECNFKQQDLDQIADQHFMTGMLTATMDDPSPEARNSEMLWTQMKSKSCGFVGYEKD